MLELKQYNYNKRVYGYTHKVRSVTMDDGTEGESVAERSGQVGDLYVGITGGYLFGPLEQHLLVAAAARLPLHRVLR